jgi:hypothetical protein
MGLAVNTDVCPDFGYVHIMWKLHVMLPLLRNVKNLVIISEAHEDTIFCTNFVKKNFPLFWLLVSSHFWCMNNACKSSHRLSDINGNSSGFTVSWN